MHDLRESLSRILRHPPVLVATDFDGTIAEIVSHPSDAAPDRTSEACLIALAGDDRFQVAVVSGRPRTDLERFLGHVPGLAMVGEHGNDWGESIDPHDAVLDLTDLLRSISKRFPGTEVEPKLRSVAFHFRNTAPELVDEAVGAAISAARSVHGFQILRGKSVVEFTTSSETKADAVQRLRDGANSVVFLGDDVTDEDVFDILGEEDVSVKVGDGETRARFRVAGVPEVAQVFADLCHMAGLEIDQV